MGGRQRALLAATAGLALSLVLAGRGDAQSPPPPTADSSQTGYVGTETCATCHDDTAKTFHTTPHAASTLGCEGCHGPGQAHVEGGGDKTKIRSFANLNPRDTSSTCMTCHNKAGQKHWMGSSHDSRNVTCTDCHAVHPKGEMLPALLKKPQVDLCTTCHLQKKAQLLRPGHMPVREGKLECTSCHNPHGTPNDRMLIQTSVNQNCYSCHAEKRGPFLFEHAPVRENCLNCHDAHGTINEKMLKVKVPLLCQQCHQTSSHPGPAYPNMSRYAFNQGCLNCHPAVHGSVHPSGNRLFR